MKRHIYIITIWIILFPLYTYSANNQITSNVEPPSKVLDNSILGVQKDLINQSSYYNGHPNRIMALLKKRLIPNLDVNHIAQNVLGSMWNKATPYQQKKFINNFVNMVIYLYGKNVSLAGNYTIKFRPLRGVDLTKTSYIQIDGIMTRKGSQPGSTITVYMKKENNHWKIYDLAFEGISIINNYKQQFKSMGNMSDAISAVENVSNRIKTKG
jgi:phospholipid transport system substrate-binding protein